MTKKQLKEALARAKQDTNAFAALQQQVDAVVEFLFTTPAKR